MRRAVLAAVVAVPALLWPGSALADLQETCWDSLPYRLEHYCRHIPPGIG